jgi:ferredoxin
VVSVRIAIDHDKRISAGQCVLAAAEVFDQRDEDDIVVLLNANPPAEPAADARAITVDESSTPGAPS